MKYPEILLLPPMMFADYFLTVLGAVESEKTYARHFAREHYELNPLWQKSIRQKRWFNPRHIILVIAANSALIWLLEFGESPDGIVQALLGALLVVFGTVIGRHVSNLLLFRYLAKHPDQISGRVTMSHPLVVSTAMYQTIVVLVPTVLIAIFSRSAFALGGVIGIALLLCIQLVWRPSAKRPIAPTNAPPTQSAHDLRTNASERTQ